MQISGSDIHLLTVFDSVARNNGFSAAQTELGLSQPTISNHITALEQRLGVKLCQRGRRGFLLTDKGKIVHEIAKSVMANLHERSEQLTALKGGLIGTLNLAIVDSMATDETLKLPQAIRAMASRAPAVGLSIDIRQPQDILNGIVSGEYQFGIGSFDNKVDGLRYEDLYSEEHSLYCETSHPILSSLDDAEMAESIYDHPWVHRGYWGRQRRSKIKTHELDRVVHDIEAQTFLILSGRCLGLLPDHAAKPLVAQGRLRALPKSVHRYNCTMQLITRASSQPKIVDLFRELLTAEYERG